jgi:hypothetical protein
MTNKLNFEVPRMHCKKVKAFINTKTSLHIAPAYVFRIANGNYIRLYAGRHASYILKAQYEGLKQRHHVDPHYQSYFTC